MDITDVSFEIYHENIDVSQGSESCSEKKFKANGSLTRGFDDLSSLSDGENNMLQDDTTTNNERVNANTYLQDDDDDEFDCMRNVDLDDKIIILDKLASLSKQTCEKDWISNPFTSTPLKRTFKNNCKFEPNDNAITEETESFLNGCASELGEIENGRCKEKIENFSKNETELLSSLQNKDVSQLSYKHIQLLLDDNEKLTREVEELKSKLNFVNVDHQHVTLEKQKIENKFKYAQNEILELSSRIKALEFQLKSQSEAKLDCQSKLSLAESTIESLNRQLENMCRNDSVARIKENYESMLSKARNEYENMSILLKGEIEGLKCELESKFNEINNLESQLRESKKKIENLELDKLKNIDSLKHKYQEILKNMSYKEEYESQLRTKDTEIESLRAQVNFLERGLSHNPCKISHNQQDILNSKSIFEHESVKQLSEKFTRCLEHLKEKRRQVCFLQSCLSTANEEITCLRNKLRKRHLDHIDENEILIDTATYVKEPRETNYIEGNESGSLKTGKQEDFRNQLEVCVEYMIRKLKDFDNDNYNDSGIIFKEIFAPLHRFWSELKTQLREEIKECSIKKKQMLEAKNMLEIALAESRNCGSANSSCSIDEVKRDINEVNKELARMKTKLDKYKERYNLLIIKHDNEMEKLKTEYQAFLERREKEHQQEKQKLLTEFKEESKALVKRMNARLLQGFDGFYE